MAAPLKVGLAGLGTVGASVVRLIEQQRAVLADKCGRPIEVVAVSARSRGKDRGIDLKKLRWVADPVELAGDPGIDAFVELIGGDGNPARAAVSAAPSTSVQSAPLTPVCAASTRPVPSALAPEAMVSSVSP